MLKVAITGNIASGKSSLENYLESLGYKIADADKINCKLLSEDTKIKDRVKEIFLGYDILDCNGALSREKIGHIIFNNIDKKIQLEEILHKEIYDKIIDFFKDNIEEKIVFVSVPLLFESGFNKIFDRIIFVSANEDIRLERLIKRNNYSVEYAKKRIASQDSEESKIKKSDYVIYNESDFENLKLQIDIILKKLI